MQGPGSTRVDGPEPDRELGNSLAGSRETSGPRPVDERLPIDTRLGPYRIMSALGEGGMGAVYLGVEEALDRLVAIKVVKREIARDPSFMHRFRREAEAAAKVNHPNVTRVHTTGVHQGAPFMVSEFCPGGSLQDRIVKEGHLPWTEAAAVTAQLARALAAVHEAGLVHRDVKPANVLIDGEGRPKLTDFGLVRKERRAGAGGQSVALTNEGEVVGSPAYMAPEQVLSQPAGPPADVYALGASLYALLTGAGPFNGAALQIMQAHLADVPPPPSVHVSGIPAALDALVLAMLEKQPEARPSAPAVAASLEALVSGKVSQRSAGLSGSTKALAGLALVAVVATGGLVAFGPRRGATTTGVAPLTTASTAATASAAPRPGPRGTPVVATAPTPAPPPSGPSFKTTWSKGSLDWRHGKDIVSVAFAPTGARALTGSYDGTIKLWDLGTGRELLSVGSPDGYRDRAAFVGDGSRFVASGWGMPTIDLFETATGKKLRSFPCLPCARVPFMPLPGDRLLLVQDAKHGERTAIVSLETGAVLNELPAFPIFFLEASADGRRAVVGDPDGNVHVWDLETKGVTKPLLDFTAHRGRLSALAISADGKRALTASRDSSRVKLWDLETGKTIRESRRHGRRRDREREGEPCRSLTFSPDGKKALLGYANWRNDEALLLWDLEAEEPKPLDVEQDGVHAAAFSPDGLLAVSGGEDHVLHVWDVAKLAPVGAVEGVREGRSVALAPDGTIAVGARSGVQLLSPGGDRLQDLDGLSGWSLAFSPDGRSLLGAGWEDVSLFDLTRESPSVRLKLKVPDQPWGVAFTADGLRAVVGTEHETLHVFDLVSDGAETAKLDAKSDVWAVAVDRRGRAFFGTQSGSLRVWDLAQPPESARLLLDKGPKVRAVAYSPDGSLALSSGDDGALRLWDTSSWKAKNLEGHGGEVGAVAFSPDGHGALSSATDGTIRLWDLASTREVAQVRLTPGDRAAGLVFLPDGKAFLAVTARGLVIKMEIVR